MNITETGSGLDTTSPFTVKTAYSDYLTVTNGGEVKLKEKSGVKWWQDKNTNDWITNDKFEITAKDNAGNEVDITKLSFIVNQHLQNQLLQLGMLPIMLILQRLLLGHLVNSVKVTNYSGKTFLPSSNPYKLLLGGTVVTGNTSGQKDGIFTVDADADAKMGLILLRQQKIYIVLLFQIKFLLKKLLRLIQQLSFIIIQAQE